MDATAIIATITPPAEQVPTDFMSYLNNTKQNDYTRLCDFAIDTLSFSTNLSESCDIGTNPVIQI